ncbi:beta-glucosidase [Cryptococcus neoformans]|nr:beta-glucosidase [Cryptococcus neoformans var. grubii Th84]OXH14280.1 beta-glucosidase [Cryptococcus neoformans var. grubii]OXH34953.1 beta-glucosidase [Cryptococcus neoformans var. grubii]OXH55314.1 beta-glucosidase [Cryptococcus neoformans var. grubii]OXH55474.1 beta-glucosidase [Cryptococcus neoformans var. grubii]
MHHSLFCKPSLCTSKTPQKRSTTIMDSRTSASLEKFVKADVGKVLEKLTLDEKVSLLAGADWWHTVSVPRLGIPAIKCSDGPNGVRGRSHFKPTPATCIPCATALASTFDPTIISKIGNLLADECQAKGVSLLLGPTVNMQHNPLNGRAFEGFSEDPYLSGMIAAGYINGLQEKGVGACIKHYVGNDMEHQRSSVDVRIPERALREIYLMPFLLAQKYAKPWAVMTSYSRLNGLHVSENPRILQTILRDEWKFDGLCISDWYGTYSTSESIKAGLDLEMPGPTMWRGQVAKWAKIAGKLDQEDIDKCALRVLKFAQNASRARPDIISGGYRPEKIIDDPEIKALNRRVAAEGIVLLKNDRNILPLNSMVRLESETPSQNQVCDRRGTSIQSLAIVGPNSQSRTVSGGGSAYLLSSYAVTPLEGLSGAAKERGIAVEHAPGCYGHKYLPMLDGWMTTADGTQGWTARFYNDDPRPTGGSAGAEPIETTVLPGSRLRINDEKPTGLAENFYLRLETYLAAPSTGLFDFGMCVAGGRATLSVDEVEVIDNGFKRKQTPGSSFYGVGTIEETGTFEFIKGRRYKVEVFYTSVVDGELLDRAANTQENQDGEEEERQPTLVMAALRVGCAPQIVPQQAITEAINIAIKCDAVIAVIGTNMDIEGEGGDRPNLELPGLTNEFIQKLLSARPDTIIVNQSGSAVTFPWIDRASTVLQSWFGGNETGNAIADVVFGDVNPSGRMSLTFPYKIQDCTAHLNWEAESGRILYGEGIFVGYRGYQETERDVMFSFGEGLSYSIFEWGPLACNFSQLEKANDIKITATLTVTNRGPLAGAEVVQIYVTPLQSGSGFRRPKQELKGFQKVFLHPGETKEVEIVLDKWALAYYNDSASCWTAERGGFAIQAAKSSRPKDKMSSRCIWLPQTMIWTGL